MSDKISDTFTLRGQFQDLGFQLLKAMGRLSQIADPNINLVIKDLKDVAEILDSLQGGVSDRIHSGRHKLEALAEAGQVINSLWG